MKKLLSLARAAVDKYNMISAGDKIAVGVSGGKDSLALLTALAKIRDFYPEKFEITAVTLDYGFNGEKGDFGKIKAYCDELGVDYYVKATNLWQVIFEDRKEKNPCSLCAKMRRGILHDTAKELGCNKVALGHHLDDAAETFVMNLFDGGVSKRLNFPVVKSSCPADKKTERQNVKQLLTELEKRYPRLKKKIIGAMQADNISQWGLE